MRCDGGTGRLVVLGGEPFRTVAGGVRFTVQRDGNAVLDDARNRPVLQTRTGGNGPSVLVVRRDGKVVLTRVSDARVMWSTAGGRR